MKAHTLQDLQTELAPFAKNGELLDMLKIADTLKSTPQINRSNAAKRANWMHVAEHMEEPRFKWSLRFKLVYAPLLALLVVLPSLTFVSQNALPGSVLYGVKRASESAQFAVTLSAGQKARLCSNQMKRRANELSQLASAQVTEKTTQSLTDAIISEAEEFKNYVNSTNGDKSQLLELRKRDASYVIDALNTAQSKSNNALSTQRIQDTIKEMQAITNEA